MEVKRFSILRLLPILGVLAISGNARAQLAKIYRVDSSGATQLLKSGRPIEWSFAQGLCADVIFQDELLKDPQHLTIANDRNVRVTIQKNEINACLNERTATFSIQSRNKEADSEGYLIELPFTTPTLVLNEDCRHLKLQASAEWSGNILAVGAKCKENQNPKRLQVELVATKLNQEFVSPMVVEVLPSVESEVLFANQKVKLKWLEAPVVLTPKPTTITTTGPTKSSIETSVFLGPVSEHHRAVAAADIYDSGHTTILHAAGAEIVNKSDTQFKLGVRFKWNRSFGWVKSIEGSASLGFLGKLNHTWRAGLVASGALFNSKIFSAGVGWGGVGMVGSEGYGIISSAGPILLLKAESLSQLFGTFVQFNGLSNKGSFLATSELTFGANGGFMSGKRKVKVGADYSLISVPASSSGDPLNYNYSSFGAHIEYPLGNY